MVQKGNLAVFESIGISETGEAMPTKIGVHVCYIKAYLHKFYETILIDYMVQKENLADFKDTNISETGEAMPTKIGVHALDINPCLHEFFGLILID